MAWPCWVLLETRAGTGDWEDERSEPEPDARTEQAGFRGGGANAGPEAGPGGREA
ncbi:MAG: hypothetical protein LBT40_18800 [Deltaproteobacteria bacterium]|nr:hypothetical protein [Deltaproteobacteria bacterium]